MDTTTPVYVALSGGVDSAVAVILLKQNFQKVIGVSHRHWPESRCCTTECIDRCREQCQQLGIEYHPVDCMVEFSNIVVDNFVSTYQEGLTPNPCVLCNQNIRFKLMLQKLFQKQNFYPENYKIATGHYARVSEKNGRFILQKGIDQTKDQSYMLYRLSQKELSHCLFPLGEKLKQDVRELAAQFKLKSAKIEDSMDVCFVKDTYGQFIRDYTGKKPEPGHIVNQEGKVLGSHEGIIHYTRGQRSGLGLSGGPWYVLALKPSKNEVVVGRISDLTLESFNIRQTNWIYDPMGLPTELRVQTRYRNREIKCSLEQTGEDVYRVHLQEPSIDVTKGQSAVFYHNDDCVGGGIIY